MQVGIGSAYTNLRRSRNLKERLRQRLPEKLSARVVPTTSCRPGPSSQPLHPSNRAAARAAGR